MHTEMVEVFKTNVRRPKQARILEGALTSQFPLIKINFDLEDCDKVLRVEGKKFAPEKVIELLHSNGYFCQVLEY
jgi:hypothetical protein